MKRYLKLRCPLPNSLTVFIKNLHVIERCSSSDKKGCGAYIKLSLRKELMMVTEMSAQVVLMVNGLY